MIYVIEFMHSNQIPLKYLNNLSTIVTQTLFTYMIRNQFLHLSLVPAFNSFVILTGFASFLSNLFKDLHWSLVHEWPPDFSRLSRDDIWLALEWNYEYLTKWATIIVFYKCIIIEWIFISLKELCYQLVAKVFIQN